MEREHDANLIYVTLIHHDFSEFDNLLFLNIVKCGLEAILNLLRECSLL